MCCDSKPVWPNRSDELFLWINCRWWTISTSLSYAGAIRCVSFPMGLWLNKVIVSSTTSSKRQGSYRCTFILEIKSRRTNCNFHWKYLSWLKRSLHFPGHRLRVRYLAGFTPQAGYSGQWKRSTKVTKWNPSFNRFHSNENERGFYRQGYVTASLCQKFSFQAVLFFKERWPIETFFRLVSFPWWPLVTSAKPCTTRICAAKRAFIWPWRTLYLTGFILIKFRTSCHRLTFWQWALASLSK